MFEFDLSKMILFGVVALLVVGPNELPAALRAAGRVLARVKRLQAEVRKSVDTLMADASLDREIESLNQTMRTNLASNPATAMRGSLPAIWRQPRARPGRGGGAGICVAGNAGLSRAARRSGPAGRGRSDADLSSTGWIVLGLRPDETGAPR